MLPCVLLYEMLAGEAPLPGVVVSPRGIRPDLPEAVEKVIFKAMAQNPDARFQSAREFQNALSSALRPVVPVQTSVPQSASPQPIQTSAPPPPVQKKTNWAAIVLGVILVIVICIGIVWIFNWLNNQDGQTPIEPKLSQHKNQNRHKNRNPPSRQKSHPMWKIRLSHPMAARIYRTFVVLAGLPGDSSFWGVF